MKNILVALDLSGTTGPVLAQSRLLATTLGAKLWLVHVASPEPDFVGYEVGPQSVRKAVADHLHEEHRQIQGHAEDLRSEGIDCTALLIQGATVDVILKEAADVEADLIVIGSHGHGFVKKLLLGGTSDDVVRRSRIPVLVVPVH
jgi:nucleotide-binding universal stress UspA family protein